MTFQDHPDLEARILDHFLQSGRLSSAQVSEPGAPGATALWGARVQHLIEEGALASGEVEAVLKEILGGESSLAFSLWASNVFQEHPPQDLAHGERFFDPVLVGLGGAGRVYRAFDQKMERDVALKFLRWELPHQREHLLREARAQAKVQHSNLLEVLEIAELGDQVCLVLPWVNGGTIARASQEMDLDAKIRAMLGVLAGIHAAHVAGLLHLDLKPENILVDREPGGWHPFVTDFGLVFDTSSRKLRGTGTPPYASPELTQRDVDRLDARSDVYALGITLHVLLTGRFPFEAAPPRSGQDGQMEDLLRIAFRASSLAPERRYPTAMAMAGDLKACLEGKPIEERKAEVGYTARLWYRRNRLSALFGGAALATLLIGGTVAEGKILRSHQRVFWAQRFAQEAVRMEGYLRFARMLQLHDTSRDQALIQERMADLRKEAATNAAARGPAHWALGQGCLLLGDGDGAQAEAEQALALGYDLAPVKQLLGEAMLLRYQVALQEFDTYTDRAVRVERLSALQRRLRDPALALLRQTRTGLGTPQEIRVALAEGRTDQAMRMAQGVLWHEPWNYDPLLDIAESRMLMGLEARDSGRLEEAKGHFLAALDDLKAPETIAPSDDRIPRLRARIWELAQRLNLDGRGRNAAITASLACVATALKVRPGDPELLVWEADLQVAFARQAEETPMEVEPALQRSEATCRALLASHPSLKLQARLHQTLAKVANERVTLAKQAGHSPGKQLEIAILEGESAVATGIAREEAYFSLGYAYRQMAEVAEAARGEDPVPTLNKAGWYMSQAAELNPSPFNWCYCAYFQHAQAESRLARGEDPTANIQAGLTYIAKAEARNAQWPSVFDIKSELLRIQSRWDLAHGGDPMPALEKSVAIMRGPASGGDPYFSYILADRLLARAQICLELDRPFGPDLAKAEHACELCARQHTLCPVAMQRAEIQFLRTRERVRQGQAYNLSFGALDASLGQENDEDTARTRFKVARWEAWVKLCRRENPSRAMAALDQALLVLASKGAENNEVILLQAERSLLLAALALSQRRVFLGHLAAARASLERVLGRAPRHPQALHLNALLGVLGDPGPGAPSVPRWVRNDGNPAERALTLLLDQPTWTTEEGRYVLAVEPMAALLHAR